MNVFYITCDTFDFLTFDFWTFDFLTFNYLNLNLIELCINFANPTRKFKTILSVSFDIKMSFELQINFRMIDVVRQDKKICPDHSIPV